MAGTFRSLYRWILPGWLVDGADGEKTATALTAMVDASVDRLRLGLESRLPSRAGESALALTGEDRGIVRGRDETDEHYALRLIAWRYPRGHRVRGSAYALLSQISEYFGGLSCWTQDARGTRYHRDETGSESVSRGNDWPWDLLSSSMYWSRFWVIIDASSVASPFADLSSAFDVQGGSLGQSGISAGDVAAIRRLFIGRAWRPAGTQPEWLIVSFDGSIPVPDTHTFPPPATSWGVWSTLDGSNRAVSSRDTAFRYWSLSPAHNNSYYGNPSRYANSLRLVEDPAFTEGEPDNFALSTTLPSGATYAGDPDANSWGPIALPDDGSPVQ